MTRLMDAALGTALIAQGIAPLLAPLSHPAHVAALHQAHRAAGAEAVLTATFQANPITLGEQLEPLCQNAVQLARASGAALILGCIGPIHSPGKSEEFTDLEALARTAKALDGVDGYLIETASSPAALAAAAFLVRRWPGVPIWLSLTYHRVEGQLVTFSGNRPEYFARRAEKEGLAVLGVNCGKDLGPPDLAEIVRVYRDQTGLPLLARPNAGTPEAPIGLDVLQRVSLNADWVGGCCGTTAEHLRALRFALSS